MRDFPILMSGGEWRQFPECLKGVPWELIATHEKQAKLNHGQSLSRLAERGGLDPIELRCVLTDESYTWGDGRSRTDKLKESIRWLLNKLQQKESS